MSLNEEKTAQEQLADFREERLRLSEQVTFCQSIDRLLQNADWRIVIEKQFMQDDALRAARMIGDPRLGAKEQADMVGIAAAPGHLQRFISAQKAMGLAAENQISQIDANIAELQLEIDGEEASAEGYTPVGED